MTVILVLTLFFTIIQPLALVQGKKVAEPKAKAAFDAAEHARHQASICQLPLLKGDVA